MLDTELIEIKNNHGLEPALPKKRIAVASGKNVLKQANRVILNQQMAVMEEQRLNILFQILGITLHELNQPLTSLLGNIELMLLNQDNPEKLKENIKRVDDAGRRFSQIIRKIQNIRQGKTMIQDHLFCPMKTNTQWKFLALVGEAEISDTIGTLTGKINDAILIRPETMGLGFDLDDDADIDLFIVDETYLGRWGADIVKRVKHHNNEIPVLLVLHNDCENSAFHLIQDGVDDYCTVAELDLERFHRILRHVKEKARARHQINAALNDLEGMSIPDQQTGLFQRRFFRDALEREITKVKRNDISCTICKMDINDLIGENRCKNKSDLILKDTARILQATLGERDLVCRYGNESFAFTLSNLSTGDAERICRDLQEVLGHYFVTSFGLENTPRVFIGMTRFCPDQVYPAGELMERMDAATQKARSTGISPLFLSA